MNTQLWNEVWETNARSVLSRAQAKKQARVQMFPQVWDHMEKHIWGQAWPGRTKNLVWSQANEDIENE